MSTALPKKLAALLLAGLALWLSLRYLFPIFLPFFWGTLLALAAEPMVSWFHRRTGLSRSLAAGIGVTLTLGVLLLLAAFVGALLLRQLQELSGVIPDLEGTALSGLSALKTWLLDAAENAPAPLRSIASRSVSELFAGSSDLVGRFSAWVLSLMGRLVSGLPDSALGIGTWLLACYMISAKLPSIRFRIARLLPESWHHRIKPLLRRLKGALAGWLAAQLKLCSITFGVLAAGFFLLRFSHWAVWAAVISLLDALPVLGSGIALVPWSIVCFLQGETVRGIGLLGIWAAAAMLRSVLEPKLVGKQLGLDPLVTLAAIYAGYRLWGFGGMLLAPLLTVAAVQTLRSVAD